MINLNPKIWLGCLASYNNGILHGEWVDARDYNELYDSLESILESSPEPNAEEYYIADYEDFEDFLNSKDCTYMSIDDIAVLGEFLYNLSENSELEIMNYLIADCNYSLESALDIKDDVQYFEGTMLDYAYEYAEMCLEIPESIEAYFNYEQLAYDLSFDCYETTNYIITNHGQI